MTASAYFSYLIRIWQSGDPSLNRWHASLQDPTSQQVVYFKTIEELFEFLRKQSFFDGNKLTTCQNDISIDG